MSHQSAQRDGIQAVSVLIPIAERSTELQGVVRESAEQLAALGVKAEFVLLLSEPSSEMRERVQEVRNQDAARVRVIQFAPTASRAAMLRAGVERAEANVVLTLPLCYEVEPAAIAVMLRALEAGADLAFAPRGSGGRGKRARLQSRAFNRLLALAAGSDFTDVTSDTRAMRREVLQEVPIYGDFHRYLPLLADRAGFRVEEVPAREHPHSTRSSRYAAALYLWRLLDVLSVFFLSRFTRRPLRLFGGVGSVFAALGGAILAIVSFERLVFERAIADRPILVLSALMFTVGVQMLAIGLLGELILFFHARRLRDYRIAAVYGTRERPYSERD